MVHHVPGRMRVRVDGTRDEAEMLHRVQPLLAGLPGISSVRANAASGSVVILYGAVAPARAGGAVEAVRKREARAPKLLLPLALNVGTRLLLKRRRTASWWLDVALLAFDAFTILGGSRPPSAAPRRRGGVRVRPVRKGLS